jgi:D-3-phosphoglycerate dehydrogenase
MAFKVVARLGYDVTIALKMLPKIGAELVQAPIWTEEGIIQHAADADAVIVSAIDPYTSKAIRALAKCRIISRVGIGYNNIDVQEATRQGIPVAVVQDASVEEVSDHSIAFILAFSRKLFPLAQAVRSGAWVAASKEIINVRGRMFRLNQQVLGIVGVGRIGSRVAMKACAFGMRVLGYDPYLTSADIARFGAEKVEFDELLQGSDFITLHAPLTTETEHMFGLKEFQKMKPTAVIINTARGPIIDSQALYEFLIDGSIAGAGIDVTEPEPLRPDDPLLKLPQVLITAHSAYFSETSNRELQEKATQAVILALQGIYPPTLINPEVKQQSNRRIA